MARSFNGSTGKIALPVSFNPTAVSFSIAVWINPAANAGTNQRTILCGDAFTHGFNLQLGSATGSPSKLEMDVTNSSLFAQSTGTIADGAWHHAGFSYNNGSGAWAFYIDGAVSGTGTGASGAFTSAQYWVGANNSGDAPPPVLFFSGSMADLFVFNGILSAGQFAGLGKGVRPPQMFTSGTSPFLYMPLDGLSSPEPDFSGQARNGTLTGTALASGPPTTLFTPRWPQFLTPRTDPFLVFQQQTLAIPLQTSVAVTLGVHS